MNGYYFITDSSLSMKGDVHDVKAAMKAGVKVIQYRNKNATTLQMYEEALKLRKLVKKSLFLINNRVDIALAVDADGVHIGTEDMPYKIARKMLGKNKFIGMTVHNVKEAVHAQELGAQYIGVSPIFATSTKPDAGKPAGIKLIEKIRKKVSIPIVAIGGINLDNAQEVVLAGADALCAISAVVAKKNVVREIHKFQKLFESKGYIF